MQITEKYGYQRQISTGKLILQFLVLTIYLPGLHFHVIPNQNDDLTSLFLDRTNAEWRRSWHRECHRRCRSDLLPHIEIACAVDIYRDKRSASSNDRNHINKIDRKSSHSFLKGKSFRLNRKRRGIMQECCYSKGCTWEEYAETCTSSGRIPADDANNCE